MTTLKKVYDDDDTARCTTVLNVAAWLIFNLQHSGHISNALIGLCLLWVSELIE